MYNDAEANKRECTGRNLLKMWLFISQTNKLMKGLSFHKPIVQSEK